MSGVFPLMRSFLYGSGMDILKWQALMCSEIGDLRGATLNMTSSFKNVLTMKHIVVCGVESGWKYGHGDESISSLEGPLLIANSEGKAQGVSIERGLRVQDVLGRMIILQEVGKIPTGELEESKKNTKAKQGPAL